MKIINSVILPLVLMLGAAVPAVLAQQSQQSDGATASALDQRPEMPNLFFRKEQRRVLEAVRQGVVEEDDFDIEEFVPVVIVEDALPVADDTDTRARAQDLRFDAYIINRGNGKKVLWVNGQEVDLQTDSQYLASRGIVVNADDSGSASESLRIEDGVLKAEDEFLSAKVEAKVGQVISASGGVEESLPVVVVRKK